MRIKAKILALILILLTGCDVLISDGTGIEYDEGTVVYVNLEGGFWGIITDRNENFDVTNLPVEFRQDSLRVGFLYKFSEQQVSIHQWGRIIDLIEIKKL